MRCHICPKQASCRVPRDLVRFDRVAHRLEEEHRNPLLQERLHHYVDHGECLVESGVVEV